MPDGHHRVVPDHARSGIAHNLFNALAHLGFIAVDCAVLAGGFSNTVGAFHQAFLRIRPELGTFLA